MSHGHIQRYLTAYINVREALGFQMRAERTLLRDFVSFVETRAQGGAHPRSVRG